MTESIMAALERFNFLVEDAKRHFGQWDACDPVSWAILRLVQAQNDFTYAIELTVAYGVDDRAVEEAIAERIKAADALLEAIKAEPRGFQ